MRWLHDEAARADPEGLYSKAMPHAVRPSTIGQRARVSEALVANLAGADDFDTLRRNVLNPGNADWTEQGVREELLKRGADQDYIERAMAHVVGPTEDEWYQGFVEQGMKADEVEALKDIIARVADLHELTPRELIGMTQAGKPISLDELGKYRGPTLYQSVLDANKARGFETLPIDHPTHVRMQELANEELQSIVKSPEAKKKLTAYINAVENRRVTQGGRPTGARVEFHGPKPPDGIPSAVNPFDRDEAHAVRAFRMNQTTQGPVEMRNVDDLIPEYVRPASQGTVSAADVAGGIQKPIKVTPGGRVLDGHNRLAAAKEAGHKQVPVVVETPTTPRPAGETGGPIHIGGALNADDHMRLLRRVFSEEDIRSQALWYDQMRSSILSLAGNDPEVGAKMLLRFAYTQMNTSPEQGMRFVLRFGEDLHTGALDPATMLARLGRGDRGRGPWALWAERQAPAEVGCRHLA